MLPFWSVLVNGLPGQTIGLVIERAIKVGNSTGVKLLQRLLCLAPEGEKMGGFNLVGALELLHHQEGIGKDVKISDVQVLGQLQAQEEGPVFGHVIGGFPQITVILGPLVSAGVEEHGAGPGWPRIAPGGAVHVKTPDTAVFFLEERGRFLKKLG